MSEGARAAGGERAMAARPVRVQRMVGVLVLVVAVCLGLTLLMMALQRGSGKVPASLHITKSAAHGDFKTGKLIWIGEVVNRSDASVDAPWVLVTVYDPTGASVDTGEAMATGTIKAGQSRSYTTTFDTRYLQDLRVIPALELANTRPLGM